MSALDEAESRIFRHVPHPHIEARRAAGPAKAADQVPTHSAYARFNAWFGVMVTREVGSMTCAYLFCALALVSLPSAIASHSVIVIVSWIAQTLLQLVLLSVILYGQSVQSAASDARSEQTYHDASATLHECLQLQEHLKAQDEVLVDALGRLKVLAPDGDA